MMKHCLATGSRAAGRRSSCAVVKVVALALLLALQSVVVHGKVVINEIMINPLNASWGPWLELHNTNTTSAVSLDGYQLAAFEFTTPTIIYRYNFSSTQILPAGGYLTMGQTSNGIDHTVVWPQLPSFPPDGSARGSANSLILYLLNSTSGADDPNTDSVNWNINSGNSFFQKPFPAQAGRSLSRKFGIKFEEFAESWCQSSSFIDGVVGSDKASPGKANEYDCSLSPTRAPVTRAPTATPTTHILYVNEIMLNPLDASSGPWFELHNTNDTALPLAGHRLFGEEVGADSVQFMSFARNASIAASGYLTIGKTNLSGHVDVVWPTMPSFPADGSARGSHNRLTFFRPNFATGASVLWNINSTTSNLTLPFPAQPGASLSRISAAHDKATQDPSNWCTSTTFINGIVTNDKGSPRKSNANTCSAAAPTTPAPAKAPVTASPTKAPTKAPVPVVTPVTKAPTKAPTEAPVTNTPTKAPTKAPMQVVTPVTKAPTKKPTKAPTKKPTKTPTKAPVVDAALPQLTGLDLFDAHRNQKIITLTNGLLVRLPTGMTSPALNVVATFDATRRPKVESVVFGLNSNSRYSIEAKAAFALCGNDGSDIFSCGAKLGCGNHTVVATPFGGTRGTGSSGMHISVSFTIAGCA